MSTKIIGNRIYLKILTTEDVGDTYLNWMRDEETVQFLESRWTAYSIEDLRAYVKQMNDSSKDFLFGIYLKENDKHIGNIKIGEINQIHKFGDIGLIIGNKQLWGKGYGTEAIKLATDYAFRELNLNKLKAGVYANNIGSYNAFIKAGYSEVGRYKNHRFHKDKFVDEILVEKCKDPEVH